MKRASSYAGKVQQNEVDWTAENESKYEMIEIFHSLKLN